MIVTDILNTQSFILDKKTIPGAENLGERAGLIQSDNFQSRARGFQLKHDGGVRFNIQTKAPDTEGKN